jgi:predicted DNA-binding transcriptional regulator AlpA
MGRKRVWASDAERQRARRQREAADGLRHLRVALSVDAAKALDDLMRRRRLSASEAIEAALLAEPAPTRQVMSDPPTDDAPVMRPVGGGRHATKIAADSKPDVRKAEKSPARRNTEKSVTIGQERIMLAPEVAKKFGVHPDTVTRAMEDGRLPPPIIIGRFRGYTASMLVGVKLELYQHRWTADDDACLVDALNRGLSEVAASRLMDRTLAAVKFRAIILRKRGASIAMALPRWRTDEINIMIEMFNVGEPVRKIAERLGRREEAIRQKMSRMGFQYRHDHKDAEGFEKKAVDSWLQKGVFVGAPLRVLDDADDALSVIEEVKTFGGYDGIQCESA